MGTPLFVPVPGGMELMIILGIAILLFGANKIPELARSSGQAMGEFRRGREELETEIREAAAEPESAPETTHVERDDAA